MLIPDILEQNTNHLHSSLDKKKRIPEASSTPFYISLADERLCKLTSNHTTSCTREDGSCSNLLLDITADKFVESLPYRFVKALNDEDKIIVRNQPQ